MFISYSNDDFNIDLLTESIKQHAPKGLTRGGGMEHSYLAVYISLSVRLRQLTDKHTD